MTGEKERIPELRELIRAINQRRQTRGDGDLVLMAVKHTAFIRPGKNKALAAPPPHSAASYWAWNTGQRVSVLTNDDQI